MSTPLAASLLVVAFAVATVLAETLPRRVAWLPIGLLCAVGFWIFFELARFDHGHAELLFTVGLLGAPIVAIFGGAAWGTRRFYGWPDFGPHPGRAALVAAAILAGVLAGSRTKEGDVRRTRAQAEGMRVRLVSWQEEHGRWPGRLEPNKASAPRTHMGALAPPPYAYGLDRDGRAVIEFPVDSERRLVLDVATGVWRSSRKPAVARPITEEDAPP